jgi:hypothetical protein
VREKVTLGRDFDSATAEDLLAGVLQHSQGHLHLECRRGLGPAGMFVSTRLLPLYWLKDKNTRLLSELGFERCDLIRVRKAIGSLFLHLN